MATTIGNFDFEGLPSQDIHFDYYGKKAVFVMSTKASIYQVFSDGNYKKLSEITGYEYPITHCSWAHPLFGSVIATGCVDGRVVIHKENNNKWEKLFVLEDKKHMITSLKFNIYPNNQVLELFVGYSDGTGYIIHNNKDSWFSHCFKTHDFGVNSVCWINMKASEGVSGFVTAGNDNSVKYWNNTYSPSYKTELKETLEKVHNSSIKIAESFHSDETSLLQQDMLITVDDDDEAYIYSITHNTNSAAILKPEPVRFGQDQKPQGINHLEWTKCGGFLAISTTDTFYLYKNVDGEWIIYSSLNNEGSMVNHYDNEQ